MNGICKIFNKLDELENKIIDKMSELAEIQKAIDRKKRVETFF